MLKIIPLISSTLIIISFFENQALSKTIDVNKFLNKTSLMAKKEKYPPLKKGQFISESTARLIHKQRWKKVNTKNLISQLKNREEIKLITDSKKFPQEKNITQIQSLTQTLPNTKQILTSFEIIDALIPSPATYVQNTQNLPIPTENPRPNPNRDRFLQPLPQPTQLETPKEQELEPLPSQPLPEKPDQKIFVQRILVSGSTVLTPQEINTLVQPFEKRLVNVLELRQVADQITEIYLERGYITSRAILPVQTISEGVVRIEIIEGILGEIQIEGTKRLQDSYIKSRIRLGVRKPLDTAMLENQLRLLRTDPLFKNLEASLRPSKTLGESILIVDVKETNPLELSMNIDNYSTPTVGSERTGWTAIHRNLTGRGDSLAASYNTTRLFDDKSDVFDFIYNLPINAMNGSVQVRVAPNSNEIGVAENVEISGTTDLYEFSFRQPLLRNPRQEFSLSLGVSYQRTKNFLNGELYNFSDDTENNGINSTTVIRLGQDYIRQDLQGAWALRSQFNIGTGLFDATIRKDPEPDGHFFSWLGQVQRVQRLSNSHLLIVQGDLQLSSTGLLSYQKFIIGGGLSLRGYSQNIRSGDNGFKFSIEDRITVYRDESGLPLIQFTPFIDIGAVWDNGSNHNNEDLPDQRFLAGAGIGLIWQPLPQVDLRLDYGLPLVNLDDRGNNAQDSGFYFSLIVRPF
ncbi:MAG: ShlB/FhaC/HecB family hemolysin secretion/activation protein [Trichodesmium sp. MAG_R04]|nr:ShlB/FhaC/HecB family hemolysin secretion/activation protein [Trichodesmium sp. MAG_R04]